MDANNQNIHRIKFDNYYLKNCSSGGINRLKSGNWKWKWKWNRNRYNEHEKSISLNSTNKVWINIEQKWWANNDIRFNHVVCPLVSMCSSSCTVWCSLPFTNKYQLKIIAHICPCMFMCVCARPGARRLGISLNFHPHPFNYFNLKFKFCLVAKYTKCMRIYFQNDDTRRRWCHFMHLYFDISIDQFTAGR